MPSQTDRLSDLLLRFRVKISETADDLCRQALEAMQQGRLPEAIRHARAALGDGVSRNERSTQAIACAYLAAAYARQHNFGEAVQQAEDCQRLFKQSGGLRNRAFARALLATIYHLQLDWISTKLVSILEEGQFDLKDLKNKALRKGDTRQAVVYYHQFVEFDNNLRRARWLSAISRALPLQWIPVIDEMQPDPRLRSPQIAGYMEPVLIITNSLDKEGYPLPNLFALKKKGAGAPISPIDPTRITGALYAAYRVPKIGSPDTDPPVPTSLDADVVYVAIKIDPESARLAGYKEGDYLLVRSVRPADIDCQLQRGDSDLTGWSFEFGEDGKTKFFTGVPPKYVGETRVRMFDVQIDAILRRVPQP